MPISRSQMPRQMYGLGSFVKSIGKGIKKIVKSPIGKAAILGFGANALMPGGLGSLFSGGSGLASMFGKAKSLIGGLSGKQLFGGALALGGAFGGMEDQQLEELKSNPEALANYLRQYYSNLNQDATPTQVEEFVQRNMQANGGRIGYADGTEKIVQPSASMMVDTTTSNPIPDNVAELEIAEVAKIMIGPGRSGIGEPEDGTMKGYQFFRTQYLPKKVKEISENFGIEESDVLRMIREEMMQYIDTPKSLEKPKMAYGGRMGYAYGSDNLVEQASGIEGLDININPKGVKELDLRDSGGFIPPVGVKEKADDIPAMLSNNEFVFTADAVRAAGGGSVNKGAQIMYDTMKKLENGGTV
jgi:hypothetical protein